MLEAVGGWPSGEVLGLDFETTGIDRFNDVPVSYALVSVVEGIVVRSWSGLIDPGREIPAEATAVHGISTARARAEGMPLHAAISLVSDAVVAASARGVPLAGMKLDYDLTILETQARDLFGSGPCSPRG
jgi:DNA polymerase-3 subunit epsilon